MSETQGLLQEERRLRKPTISKRNTSRYASRKKSRRIVDEYKDLHCGPEGVQMSDSMTPHDHLYEAWMLVGALIQNAMNEVDFRNK